MNEAMADQSFGFLVLDKPSGMTSHHCVGRVRRAYGLRRVGHGGTLDPSVTGVLPIAVGPATRLLPYLVGHKSYEGTVQLGVHTDSDDLTGDVIEQRSVPPLTAAEIEAVLGKFRGAILQVPPQVSAVHVQGERAYARARRGEWMNLQARNVTIHQLALQHWDASSGRIALSIRCSAGTYIRSLARDLGKALGCGGALATLRRTGTLGFNLEQAINLEDLATPDPPALIPPLSALGHLPRQTLEPADLAGWRCGRPLPALGQHHPQEVVATLNPDGNLAGLALASEDGLLQPRVVFDAAG